MHYYYVFNLLEYNGIAIIANNHIYIYAHLFRFTHIMTFLYVPRCLQLQTYISSYTQGPLLVFRALGVCQEPLENTCRMTNYNLM